MFYGSITIFMSMYIGNGGVRSPYHTPTSRNPPKTPVFRLLPTFCPWKEPKIAVYFPLYIYFLNLNLFSPSRPCMDVHCTCSFPAAHSTISDEVIFLASNSSFFLDLCCVRGGGRCFFSVWRGSWERTVGPISHHSALTRTMGQIRTHFNSTSTWTAWRATVQLGKKSADLWCFLDFTFTLFPVNDER